jgi:hypothetical protein
MSNSDRICLAVVLPDAAVADAASAARLPPAQAVSSIGNHGQRSVRYVPVSFVAQDWKVTPRRIRSLLSDSRLEGRRLENGYWEVAYPYRYTFGTRGPDLTRGKKPEARAE